MLAHAQLSLRIINYGEKSGSVSWTGLMKTNSTVQLEKKIYYVAGGSVAAFVFGGCMVARVPTRSQHKSAHRGALAVVQRVVVTLRLCNPHKKVSGTCRAHRFSCSSMSRSRVITLCACEACSNGVTAESSDVHAECKTIRTC